MIGLMIKMAKFRIGQKVSRKAAKKLGLRPVAGLMGLIGGFKTM
jgi:hypothetical protein